MVKGGSEKDLKENILSKIDEIQSKLEDGEINLAEALERIKELKDEYISQINKIKPNIKDPEQSWHSFIGKKFQILVYNSIKAYIEDLKKEYPEFEGLCVLKESEIKKNDYLFRKLAVRYGSYLLLPDVDIVIADYKFDDPWKSKILAIVSCKTSLRERIAQSCYWKLKLLSSDVTKHIKVYLATTDNDKDFFIDDKRKECFNGRSRNRIIAEYELDGIYIMRDDFKEEWESEKVKRYEKLFEDLMKLINGKK